MLINFKFQAASSDDEHNSLDIDRLILMLQPGCMKFSQHQFTLFDCLLTVIKSCALYLWCKVLSSMVQKLLLMILQDSISDKENFVPGKWSVFYGKMITSWTDRLMFIKTTVTCPRVWTNRWPSGELTCEKYTYQKVHSTVMFNILIIS
jgi:hypothetical protein